MVQAAYHHHIGTAWQFNVCPCCGTLSSLSACSICYCICDKISCVADDTGDKRSSRFLYSLEVSGMEHCYAARMMLKPQLKKAFMGAGQAWPRLAVHCDQERHVHGASKSTRLYYSIGGSAKMLGRVQKNAVSNFLTSESEVRLMMTWAGCLLLTVQYAGRSNYVGPAVASEMYSPMKKTLSLIKGSCDILIRHQATC